jgi:hypothetical protein
MIRAALLLALLITPPAQAQLAGKRADLAQPVTLAPGQAAIVIGFRRPDAASLGKSGQLAFARYDLARRDLVLVPDGAKKKGDTTTYGIKVASDDRNAPLEHIVMLVSPGDYVLLGATPGAVAGVTNSFCFGAPTFNVAAGETVYFGDITPYIGVLLADGSRTNAMAWSDHPEDARAAVAGHPALAAGFRPAELRNAALYRCFGVEMNAYYIPGKANLPSLAETAGVDPAKPADLSKVKETPWE